MMKSVQSNLNPTSMGRSSHQAPHQSPHQPSPQSLAQSSPQSSQRRAFDSSAVPEFLKNGWLISYGPDRVLLGWGELRASDSPTPLIGSETTCAVFAPDFYLRNAKPWVHSASWDLVRRKDLSAWIAESELGAANRDRTERAVAVAAPLLQDYQWQEPEQRIFDERLDTIFAGMRERGLKKAVPVVFAEAQGSVNEGRRAQILTNLLRLPPSLYLYGLWGLPDDAADSPKEKEAAQASDPAGASSQPVVSIERHRLRTSSGIMGATPEVLFSARPEVTSRGLRLRVETAAVAGTRANSERAAEALLSDPKERHEHQLVIDDIREVLSQVGEVVVGPTGVVELPTLCHLKTPIELRTNRLMDAEELARLLHPTPALGLAPRSMGFREMERWDDTSSRGRFGAPFGVHAHLGEEGAVTECLVAIRNIQWQGDLIRLGSGCGVVPASEAGREWQELRLKRDSVKRMLGV